MTRLFIATGIALGLLTGGLVNQGALVPASSHGGGSQVQSESAGRCPLIYAPVICDGGKVYSNQCLADQHHAKNCVPLGV